MEHNPRWSRKIFAFECAPIEIWPTVDPSEFPEDDRATFSGRKKAVELYVKGVRLCEISDATGLSPSRIIEWTKACARWHQDGQIMGFRALVPYQPNRNYRRVAEIERQLPGQKGGRAGSLRFTLSRIPDAEAKLTKIALKKAQDLGVPMNRLRPKDFHTATLNFFKENDVSGWPFDTEYLGQKSIDAYFNEIKELHFDSAVNAHGDEQARVRAHGGTAIPTLITFEQPFDAIEIDAFSINALLTC